MIPTCLTGWDMAGVIGTTREMEKIKRKSSQVTGTIQNSLWDPSFLLRTWWPRELTRVRNSRQHVVSGQMMVSWQSQDWMTRLLTCLPTSPPGLHMLIRPRQCLLSHQEKHLPEPMPVSPFTWPSATAPAASSLVLTKRRLLLFVLRCTLLKQQASQEWRQPSHSGAPDQRRTKSYGVKLATHSNAQVVVQPLSRVWLFATPGTAARQASLSITSSRSLLQLMSVESVTHLGFPRRKAGLPQEPAISEARLLRTALNLQALKLTPQGAPEAQSSGHLTHHEPSQSPGRSPRTKFT